MKAELNHSKEVITQWGHKQLLSLGYTLKNNQPEDVQDTPWSYVARFITTDGYIYLKHTPSQLALEAPIINILRNQFKAAVPEVIAHDATLNTLLMKDAGQPLRGILKQKFNGTLLCKASDQFTSLQISIAGHIDVFLDMGVPDWRLENLPELYLWLLSKTDVLIAEGLSNEEMGLLKALHRTVSDLCEKLSSYAITQTIVQPDFNDNNLLIDTPNHITLIDLGEIAISHPFFSLINFLFVIKKHHALEETSDAYLNLEACCFKAFNLPEKQLEEAVALARPLFFVYAALGNYRLMQACDKTKFIGAFERHGRVSPSLKEFMRVCEAQ